MTAGDMEKYKILVAEKEKLEAFITSSTNKCLITKMKLSVVNTAIHRLEYEIQDELRVTYLRELLSADSLADKVILEEEP